MIHGMEIQYTDMLNISGCDVATINEYLHDTLKHIYCAGNELRVLPNNMPDSVMYIYCYNLLCFKETNGRCMKSPAGISLMGI